MARHIAPNTRQVNQHGRGEPTSTPGPASMDPTNPMARTINATRGNSTPITLQWGEDVNNQQPVQHRSQLENRRRTNASKTQTTTEKSKEKY